MCVVWCGDYERIRQARDELARWTQQWLSNCFKSDHNTRRFIATNSFAWWAIQKRIRTKAGTEVVDEAHYEYQKISIPSIIRPKTWGSHEAEQLPQVDWQNLRAVADWPTNRLQPCTHGPSVQKKNITIIIVFFAFYLFDFARAPVVFSLWKQLFT